jgi:hypothetical protein
VTVRKLWRRLTRLGSLRLRVVVAFVVLLSVTLAVAGTEVYKTTEDRLLDELDLDLTLSANQALQHLEQSGGIYTLMSGDVQALAYPGEKDLGIYVLSLDGAMWDKAGADLQTALPLTEKVYTTSVQGEDWRVLARPIIGAPSTAPCPRCRPNSTSSCRWPWSLRLWPATSWPAGRCGRSPASPTPPSR